jgi:phosphoglycolate phosphatase
MSLMSQRNSQPIGIACPAAIVWDLDGTIIDSAPDLAAALNTLLRNHGKAAVCDASVRRMIGNGVAKLIERGFAERGTTIGTTALQSLQPEFMSIYCERATHLSRLYPGAREAIQAFHESGVPQAVCTNKPEAISRTILHDMELDRYFSCVIGGDSLPHRKPHPLPLQTCLNELGTMAESTLLIGDSAVDVETARAIGMTIGLVTHGYARQPVATLGADFLIADLATLPGELDPLQSQHERLAR